MSNSPQPSAHEQLLTLQRATFARLEEEIRSRQKRESRTLKLFRRRYDRETRTYRKVSTKSALVDRVAQADIVYCGDFHTLRQAQRTPIKVLRPLVMAKNRQIILALEFIPKSQEDLANEYVQGQVEEDDFLKGILYQERWGFSWFNYRQIFEFARRHKLEIMGLSSNFMDELSLEARDDLAADYILDATLAEPEKLIFCIYGDLHIADPHIPRSVKVRLQKHRERRQTVTIFQNSEPIYWQLAEKGLESTVDVVEIGRDKFCVLSAPPWIKWQSYQSWLEDHSILMDQSDESAEDETATPDYYHQVLEMAQKVASFLSVTPNGLEHFSILTATDTKIIDQLKDYCAACRRRSFPIEALVRAEIVENRSYFFAEHSALYLSDLSENRAAEKAGQLVAGKLDREGWVFGDATDAQEIFYRQALWEAVGFFASKIINHKRKCDQYRDFERLLVRTRRQRLKGRFKNEREAARQLLVHRRYELRRLRSGKTTGAPQKLYRLPPVIFFMAASRLGQILADWMYYQMVKGEIDLTVVRTLFSPITRAPDAGQTRYWELAKTLETHRADRKSKEDRF